MTPMKCRPRVVQITTISGADNDPTPRLMVVLKRMPGEVIDSLGCSHRIGSFLEIDTIARLPEEWHKVAASTGTCVFGMKLADIPDGLNENHLKQFLPIAAVNSSRCSPHPGQLSRAGQCHKPVQFAIVSVDLR
jgi:hypothetical protein